MLNGLTIRLRNMVQDRPSIFGIALVLAVILSIGDVVADVFMPKGIVWNCIRTVLALLTAVPMFSSGYFVGLKLHDEAVKSADEDGVDYIEYRLRRSANARYRRAFVALCVIALIGVLTYDTVIYTLSAAVVISLIVAIVLYCRLTPDEKILNEYGSPDPRDLIDEAAEEDAKLTMRAKKELRREKIEERKRRLRHDEDDDDDLTDDYDDEQQHHHNDSKKNEPSPLRP